MTGARQRMLGDRYVLGSTLGIGGMAEVFLGTDLRLGREVAVKVLRADLARDPTFQQRFRREAQSAALLNAPSIVSVFDSGEDTVDGSSAVPWIVMEHVQGRTLREVLQDEGPLPPARALEIVADVCAALEVAHDAGIVHRDIKPGNVMLTPTGDVKVMDFGIARAVSSVTQTMTQTANVIGTAAYLSPEQARGEHVDARSDLYSTGCLLYELLTGRAPFTGDSLVAVAYQHVREPPQPPSRLDPALSPAVDAVVLQAMAKDPAARYQTAAQMRQDLLRAAAGQPVEAPPFVPPAPLAPAAPQRRRVLPYALFALLLLAVVAGVGYGVRSLVSRPSAQVPAPAVVGLQQADAQRRLAQSDLVVGQVRRVFRDAPLGQVVEQSPGSGVSVRRGGEVDLVVSQGQEMTVVPQVVGAPQQEAEAALEQAGLTVGDVVPRMGNVAAGQVLEVLPAVGTPVPRGQRVTVVVSSGQVEVPSVVRLQVAPATAALQRAGFNVGVRLQDDPGPAGVVLAQDPPGGGPAGRASTVTIVVSRTPAAPSPAPPSPAPTVPPTPSATPTPTPTATPRPTSTSATPPTP